MEKEIVLETISKYIQYKFFFSTVYFPLFWGAFLFNIILDLVLLNKDQNQLASLSFILILGSVCCYYQVLYHEKYLYIYIYVLIIKSVTD